MGAWQVNGLASFYFRCHTHDLLLAGEDSMKDQASAEMQPYPAAGLSSFNMETEN